MYDFPTVDDSRRHDSRRDHYEREDSRRDDRRRESRRDYYERDSRDNDRRDSRRDSREDSRRENSRREDSRRESARRDNKRTSSRSPSPTISKQPKLSNDLAQKEASIEERMKKLLGATAPATASSSSSSAGPSSASSKLKTILHPSLMMDPVTKSLEMKKTGTNVLLPKANFATIKANVRGAQQTRQLKLDAVKFDTFKNPFYDRSLGLPNTQKLFHKPRKLRFAPQGKFIAEAERMRVEEQRRLLEKKIAETTERAGLELDVTESLTKLEPIPDAEWWDCQFLPSGTYDAIDNDKDKDNDNNSDANGMDIVSASDSGISYELVTHLVHHPVPLEAPSDALAAAAGSRQLMLTEKERKRLRRQRRMEALKDKQERIRIGLLPPEEAKGNMNVFYLI